MTLVLKNGASIDLSTMLQTSKPLRLTQVSVCSSGDCSALQLPVRLAIRPLPPLFNSTALLPARHSGLCCVLPHYAHRCAAMPVSACKDSVFGPRKPMYDTSQQLCLILSPGLA